MNLGIAWLCPFIAERFSDFNVSVFIKQMDIQDMDSVKVGFTEQSGNAKIELNMQLRKSMYLIHREPNQNFLQIFNF